MINKNILNYICCPKCKGEFTKKENFLACKNCSKRFEIISGIPILIDLEKLDKQHRKQILYFDNEVKRKPSYILEEWQRSYLKRFKNSIHIPADGIIADIGTGEGYMAIELAKRGNIVLACDLNLKSIIKLKKISEKLNLFKNLFFFLCSAEELPIKNNVIDAFIMNAVLEHLPKEKEAIKELERISKNKSYGLITVPLKLKYIWPFLWPVNIIHDKRIGHLRRYDRESLGKKFCNWNFLKVYYTGHLNKVIKIVINKFMKLFDVQKIEEEDSLEVTHRMGASNICVAISKRVR